MANIAIAGASGLGVGAIVGLSLAALFPTPARAAVGWVRAGLRRQ